MSKSRVKNDKENIVPPSTNKRKSSAKEKKLYYLIAEIQRQEEDSTAQGLSQYWFISSKNIVDVPVVNNETVYTGKKLKINNNEGKVVNGTCVLFSPDQKFVEEQFTQITSTSSIMETQTPASTTVLNVSTKGNVMTNGLNGNGIENGTKGGGGRKFKLPNSITVKSVPNGKSSCDSPEKENELVQVEYIGEDPLRPAGRPMMYDQQSQTDPKMYEAVVPATAAQSHQQAQQIAQLIRANNGLVVEMRNLKDANAEMRHLLGEMDAKLIRTLEILTTNPSVTYIKQEPNMARAIDESGQESVVEYSVYNESSLDQSTYMDINTSREKSLVESVTSENTPPLKKNKQKLRRSMQEAKQVVALSNNAEFTTIGSNGTQVPKYIIDSLNLSSYSAVTRKILISVFDRQTLATHSLTGKPSPAFTDRDAKMQLDPLITKDIVDFVKEACNVPESMIRSVITSKLADENKMMRLNSKKRGYSLDANTYLLNGSVGSSEGSLSKKRKADKENLG